jgi:hypothetical protein
MRRTPKSCPTCGEETAERAYSATMRIGRFRVVNESVRAALCHEREHERMPAEARQLFELRAARAVVDGVGSFAGAELRDVRRVLGLTQVELGVLLDLKAETLSRSEGSEKPIKTTTRLALRGLLVAAIEGLGAVRPTSVRSSRASLVA